MGCDIHFYVEKKIDGKWTSVDKWSQYEDEPDSVQYDDRFYTDRNYDLFAILADVRNGRGFAGCETGGGFNPIAEPRGLPNDISSEVAASAKAWEGDGHSHSWFTVAELDAYDWNQVTTLFGWVSDIGFQEWKETGSPNIWCGFVVGVPRVSNQEMQKAIDENKAGNSYTRVTWKVPYHRPAKIFLENTMPRLRSLGNPDEVRIVFWFDN